MDLTLFTPRPKTWTRVSRGPILLYAGRVSKEKNIEAFLALKHAGHEGRGRRRADPREVATGTPGRRSSSAIAPGRALAEAYANADVFVFPSKTDTFGLVMIEAMACGVPVAAYPVVGPIDVVTDPKVGCLDDDLGRAVEVALQDRRPGRVRSPRPAVHLGTMHRPAARRTLFRSAMRSERDHRRSARATRVQTLSRISSRKRRDSGTGTALCFCRKSPHPGVSLVPRPTPPRLHAHRAAGRHRDHRHPDRPAAPGRPEGPRGGQPDSSARTTSSNSASRRHNYESTNRTFPPSMNAPVGGTFLTSNGSWGVHGRILNYIEQDNAGARVNLEVGYDQPPNSTSGIPHMKIPVFMCPSEVNNRLRVKADGSPNSYPLELRLQLRHVVRLGPGDRPRRRRGLPSRTRIMPPGHSPTG